MEECYGPPFWEEQFQGRDRLHLILMSTWQGKLRPVNELWGSIKEAINTFPTNGHRCSGEGPLGKTEQRKEELREGTAGTFL